MTLSARRVNVNTVIESVFFFVARFESDLGRYLLPIRMSYHLNIVIVHLKNTTEFDRVESCPGRGLARA